MIIKNKLLLLMLVMMTSTIMFSQSSSIEDVTDIVLKNVGTIKDNNEVTGYYFFYEIDKIDKKTRAYKVKILDANLEEVAVKKIKNSKDISLVDAAFNNKSIMLKFHDPKEKVYKFKSYKTNGERVKGATKKLSKKEYRPPFYLQGKKGDNHSNALFPIPDKGFVQYAAVKNNKWGYIIDFIGGEKRWKYKSSKKSEVLEFAQHVVADDEVLVASITEFKNGFGKGWKTAVAAIDVNTGDEIFKHKLDEEIPISILNGYIDREQNEIIVFGLYFKEKEKITKAKSRGLFIASYDFEGNEKEKKYISWEKDASKLMDINSKGKIDGGNYLAFHDIIRTADGKIIALAEQFKKAIDGGSVALGIVAASLGARGGVNLTKLVIDDMMTFQLNSNLELEKIQTFEKGKSDFGIYGTAFQSPQLMAYMANSMGAFDYSFTLKNEDNSIINFGYIDYERRKGEKNGYSFGSINCVDGVLSQDNIKLSGEATDVTVLPAQPGYIMIVEYFKKEKKLDLKLEKINF